MHWALACAAAHTMEAARRIAQVAGWQSDDCMSCRADLETRRRTMRCRKRLPPYRRRSPTKRGCCEKATAGTAQGAPQSRRRSAAAATICGGGGAAARKTWCLRTPLQTWDPAAAAGSRRRRRAAAEARTHPRPKRCPSGPRPRPRGSMANALWQARGYFVHGQHVEAGALSLPDRMVPDRRRDAAAGRCMHVPAWSANRRNG